MDVLNDFLARAQQNLIIANAQSAIADIQFSIDKRNANADPRISSEDLPDKIEIVTSEYNISKRSIEKNVALFTANVSAIQAAIAALSQN